MKTIKTTLMTIVMLLCSIAANAHDFEVDGIYYGIMSYGPNKVFVTSWGNLSPSPAYSGAITIPSTVEYNGETYSVTSIGEKAFYNCDGLTDITIPNSVTSIQKDAFCRCTNLTSITIPNSVTSIGECAFQACESLTSVTIPESVTTLGDQAFHSCSNLTSVTIESQAVASMSHLWPKFGGEVTTYIFGDNITSIGISAFSGCTELTSVTIPNSVTSIGRDAFSDCTGLRSITIPESMTTLEDRTFDGCTGLTSVTIPNSVTSIGKSVFGECTGLTSITLPNSVTSIGSSTFSECRGLTSITIPNSITSIEENTFWGCTNLTSITIPNSVTSIGKSAFLNCKSLTSITIPESVTMLGNRAYQGCSNLTSVTIESQAVASMSNLKNVFGEQVTTYILGDGITSIGESAFSNCTNLTDVTIPNSVTSIGEYAFWNCTNLTCITIPNSVTSIGEYAFLNCKSLTSITIPESVTMLGNWAFSDCSNLTSVTIESQAIASMSYLKNVFGEQVTTYILGDGITSIGENAFSDCTNLTSITIPASVTTIGSSAFSDCSNLTSVTIESQAIVSMSYLKNVFGKQVTTYILGDGITFIGENTFFGCANISNISIPNSVTHIGQCAFEDCTSLTSITIPNSVESIYANMFHGCTNLTSIVVDSNNKIYDSRDNCNAIIETNSNTLIAGCQSTIIPNSVKAIGSAAFTGCTGLTSITIPNSVISIGEFVFNLCTSLTNIVVDSNNKIYDSRDNCNAIIETNSNTLIAGCSATIIPEGVTSIGNYAFPACTNLTAITIPEGVTSIGISAFLSCTGLTSITIPNSVESIGSAVFAQCTSLTNIVVDSNNIIYDSRDNCNAIIETNSNKLIAGCSATIIPEGVTSIGDGAFVRCTNLTNITIPNSVTGIGKSAFNGCTSLTSITIPNSVTGIGKSAFNGCTSLTSITIPNSVTKIDGSAFIKCENLTDVYCYAEDAPNTNLTAFDDSYIEYATLHVPESAIEEYKATAPWSQFGSFMPLSEEVVEEKNVKIDGLWYELIAKAKIAKVTKSQDSEYVGDIIIPEKVTYNGVDYSVTSIGNLAFEYCRSLTNITIPNSVTSIGDHAFNECSELTSITIPNSMISIGDGAFVRCTNLTNITIPNSVTGIGNGAFSYCSNLTSITVDQGNIIYDSRENCNAIIEIDSNTLIAGCKSTIIPNSVTSIGDEAFRGCKSLTSISIPNSVTSIGNSVFIDCAGLTSISIPNSVSSIGYHAFQYCTGLTSITIPNLVTSIGSYTFANCSSLTSITIPSSVITIGNHAFSGCSSLTSITIPNSITSIGYGAFQYCTGLTGIAIPNLVTSIGSYTFANCSSLTSITIPNSVTSIGDYAFQYCKNLTDVYCHAEDAPNTNLTAFDDSYIEYATLHVPESAIEEYKATAPWSQFGSFMPLSEDVDNFIEEELEKVLSSKRQELLAYADSIGALGYTALKDELQTLIGDGSLVENTLEAKRAELDRLNSMNTFGKEAFGLSQLVADGESLIAQKKLVSLSEAIAVAKTVLENKATSTSDDFVKAYGELVNACRTWHIRFDNIDAWNFNTSTTIGDFEVLLDVNSKMASIYRYRGTSADLEIPESITYNNDYYPVVGVGRGKANDYWSSGAICDSLTSVTLPETLRFIGRSAFNGCAELDSLVVPEYVTWIGSSAFSGTSLNELHVKATVPPVCEGNLSPIYIVYVPEGCGNAYWDSDYWKDCAIVPGAGINLFITLQEPGTLGELILQQTEYLRNVNSLKIAGNVNETDMQIIGRLQGLISVDMTELTMKSLPDRLFEGRKALTSIKLPAALESIGYSAFRECTHLYSIELPETLKRIESQAFYRSSIASIDLPEGLNYLGSSAFENCDKLEEITIPAGVRTIEGSTFWYCHKLKNVVCQEGVERIYADAFDGCEQLESITLPSTLKQCNYAFEYCKNLKQVICYAMLPPACNDKYIVTGPDECALYVPEWTINKYKLAAGWTEFYPIKPIGVLPEDITIYQDFKLTLPDSIPAGYKPNLNVGVNGYDGKDMYGNVGVELQLDGKDTLAVKNFQMNYGYYAGERWNGNNYYWDYYYNGSQLLNNVEGMQADSVTLLLSVPSGRWSFVSFPFDVKVSDIVPADSNTRWIIRRYAGDLRAKQDFANAWQNLTADSILRAGEGYIWHCANNGVFTLSAMNNSTKNQLFATDTLKVALNQYPAELAHNQGWNLVGNPFPTYYDSRALNFSAPITVWNGNTYVAYSIVDDDYVLMPGEAFFVQSAVEKEQVVFPAEGRQLFDSVRANPSYAPQVVTRAAAPRRVFNLLLNGDAQVDRTRFVINPEAKSSYELNRDASKFMSDNQDAAQLYTIEGEVNYAINERPMGNGEIALGVQFGQRGEYTIALNTNVSDTEVVLVDMLTGVETDLGVSSYTFEAEAGTVTNRFLIKLNAGLGATALHKNLAATTQVTSVNGQVVVRTAEDTEVALYTVDGKLLQKVQGAQATFQVPAGFYVVKVQNLVYKVAVTK